ncbi:MULTISPECIES: hypothetical protein [unclassified Bradyrhizobium]|uniref:hypothetical protein n=1 Tax=unclassified Bradyrhizobium TaxID=2631580 RepID=UPI0029169C3A|nr:MULTISPECIES: hypothetical protein [unclassified Bradyrhizobium]
MHSEIADATLDKVKLFTVGFGRAGDDTPVKGSGVLIKYGPLKGILTCAHVVDHLSKLKQPIGLVRFWREANEEFGTLDLSKVVSYEIGEEPWTSEAGDLAFLYLPPHLVGNIEKDGVFLDAEKNFAKAWPDDRSLIVVDAVFGLVQEFTGETTRRGSTTTTRLRGVLTPGVLREANDHGVTLQCFEENLADLPSSFGGTSGGGLWRVHVRKRDDGVFVAVHHRLIGIASSEVLEMPPIIRCQGLGVVKALLEDAVHRQGGAS